jgi:hypothetical protein
MRSARPTTRTPWTSADRGISTSSRGSPAVIDRWISSAEISSASASNAAWPAAPAASSALSVRRVCVRARCTCISQ